MSEVFNMFDQPATVENTSLYFEAWSSVIRAMQQCIAEIKQLGLSDDIEVLNLDDHADIRELPKKDYVFFSSFNQMGDEHQLEYGFFVGCSTWADTNNLRHTRLISYLASRFAPARAISIVRDNGNGGLETIGKLNIQSGTEVMPMSKSDQRSVQFIEVHSLSTTTVL